MKIKEVEQLTGITKANIRYYESQGLISPNRESNGYRTYGEIHVRELLKIKLLRILGLPIESIKALSDGKISLDEALSERKSQFQGQHQELAVSEKIINVMLDFDSAFHELDPEKYLILLEQEEENPIQRDVNTKPILPMRRLWARTLDYTIYNLILYLFAPTLFQTEGFNLFLILAEILMLIVIEPFLLSTVYTTPGKLVFGMTVTSLDGGRLTYKESLNRTLLVLQHGLGFCAPFLKEYMQISSYVTAENGGELVWEQNSELNIRDSKAWRYIVFTILFIGAIAYPAKMEYVRIFNNRSIGISNDKTDRVFLGSALHEIGFQPEAGLTGAASADNQHILVSCGFGIRRPIIHGQAFRLGEDDIVCEHRVNIGRYISLGAPTGGAVFHVLPEFLCVLALDVDRQSNGQGNQNTNTQVNGMETGHRRFKRQHQPLHDVQCFPGKVGSGSQPYSLTDLGSKQGDEHIGNVGKE